MKIDKTDVLPYYPIFLDIRGRKCVVVGGGEVALRKVRRLLDNGADVTLISPTLHPDLVRFFEERTIRLVQRNYKTGDLRGSVLVIAATNVKKTNRKVAADARKLSVLVNAADEPEHSDFIIPSYFRQGDLSVAVSTGGRSPAFARKIRTRIEEAFGKEHSILLGLVGEVRSALKEKGLKADAEAWQEALDLEVLINLVREDQREEAKTFLRDRLLHASQRKKRR